MAEVKIISNLNNTKRIKKNIENIDSALYAAGRLLEDKILQRWSQAKGGNGKPLKALTQKYAEYKKKKGRKPVRDLFLTGKLKDSLFIFKESKKKVALTFQKDQMGKAKGNYDLDNNMFKVDKKLAKNIINKINKVLFK